MMQGELEQEHLAFLMESKMSSIIRWDHPLYEPKAWCTDVSYGRYLIRKEKRGPWIAILNGSKTAFYGRTADEVKAIVERSIRATGMMRIEK